MKKKITSEEKGLLITIVILGIIIAYLISYVYFPSNSQNIPDQIKIDIIKIEGDCVDCFNVDDLSNALVEANNLGVTSEKVLSLGSTEATDAINKYGVTSVPAIIILSKDLEKISFEENLFTIKEDYAMFDKGVPYIDLSTNTIEGLVDFVEIKADNCLECTPLSQIKAQFGQLGIKENNYEIIESTSARGKELIEQNNLEFAPALLVGKNIEEYWWVFGNLKNAVVETSDYYVFRNPVAPYVDLAGNSVKGKVNITYLENSSCEDCFNATGLKGSFQQAGVYFEEEKFVDVETAHGKSLLKKYNITSIPTILLSNGIADYPVLAQPLAKVGTFERDGTFVFRAIDSLNVKYQEIGDD